VVAYLGKQMARASRDRAKEIITSGTDISPSTLSVRVTVRVSTPCADLMMLGEEEIGYVVLVLQGKH
jgi:hypothetical protein